MVVVEAIVVVFDGVLDLDAANCKVMEGGIPLLIGWSNLYIWTSSWDSSIIISSLEKKENDLVKVI